MAKVYPSALPNARGPLWNGARPRQYQIGPFPNDRLTGKFPLVPYTNFGPQGIDRNTIKLKRPRTPHTIPPSQLPD